MRFDGTKVTVMGLGHFGGGVAVARWLARLGAVVTVTDLADEKALADALAALDGSPIARFHLAGHREDDFRRTDLVVVNPAVPPGSRFLGIAVDAGVRLTSEIELFLRACAAHVVGVTGSNGKSTTAAMIAAVLQADGRHAWLGGNIGGSLLDKLDEITDDDWVVLELSSFQLWHLTPGTRMPEVAVVTNCTPNHLHWHGTYDHYATAKQRILTGQTASDLAVLGALDDAQQGEWARLVRGRLLPPWPEADLPTLSIPGEHNRANAACAAAAAAAVGCGERAIRDRLGTFHTLPGRLEPFAVVAGRRFYNDTASTTPESTIAALKALDGPMWLLAGGSDKGIDFGPLAATVAQRARGAAFYGAIREVLRDQLTARAPDLALVTTETMHEALSWCWRHSRPGECIVLSPACASYDQFQNFIARGERFVELVKQLTGACP